MHLGALVPQGWKHEFDGMDSRAAFAKMIEVAQHAEAIGLDSVWLYDHFHAVPWPAQPGTVVFECWTGMMALAMATQNVRLGQMVTCAGYRNPAYLAKVAAGIDVASGGRLEFGIGAGWYWEEFESYGYGFASNGDRLGHLRDTVEIVKRLWLDERASYDGRFASIKDAISDPKPLQQPRPPVWIGGGGEKVTLRIVAEHADWSNFMGTLETFHTKRDLLRGHCEAVDRDPGEIRMSVHCDCLVARTDTELRALLDKHPSIFGIPEEQRLQSHLIGTVNQVIDRAAKYAELGCEGFIPWFPDYPTTDSLDLFAEEVAPVLRKMTPGENP